MASEMLQKARTFEEQYSAYVPEDEQLRRLCLRDKCNAEQALRRIRAQMPLEEKMARAEVTSM